LEGEADYVETREGAVGLEGGQRLTGGAEGVCGVGGGVIDALAGVVGEAVDDVVEDVGAEMGHADLVEVGEGQGEADGGVGLDHGVDFPADVAGGFLYGEEEVVR
jgi:hypothetical protein